MKWTKNWCQKQLDLAFCRDFSKFLSFFSALRHIRIRFFLDKINNEHQKVLDSTLNFYFVFFFRPLLSNSSRNRIYLTNCSQITPAKVKKIVDCTSQQDDFLYSNFEFDHTIVTDFDLVCDQVRPIKFSTFFSQS